MDGPRATTGSQHPIPLVLVPGPPSAAFFGLQLDDEIPARTLLPLRTLPDSRRRGPTDCRAPTKVDQTTFVSPTSGH